MFFSTVNSKNKIVRNFQIMLKIKSKIGKVLWEEI